MRRSTLSLSIVAATLLALAGSMTADATVINSTNDGYSLDFTPDNGVAPQTAAEFPQTQAQRILDALSNTTTPTPGSPDGYHNGYAGLGFDAPDFDGDPRRVFVLDCSTLSNGCDSGSAPKNRINMPAATYRTAPEACVRSVVGHELFHHIQYESIDYDNWQTWGSDPVEGTARVMQDKVFSDLDTGSDSSCPGDFLSQINGYLDAPGTTLFGQAYGTALFWQYLMERLGTDSAEPGDGADFVARFWANAEAAGDNRDFVGTLRDTIADFDTNSTLEGLFQDFTIANYTKQMDVSALPDGAKYRYRDEQQTGGAPYDAVPVTDEGSLPPTVGPKTTTVSRWASKYVQADIGDCRGVAGFVVDGDRAGVGLVSQSSSGVVSRLDRSVGTHFARAILVQPKTGGQKRITRLGGVITTLGDPATVDYTFACGDYGIQLKDPTTAHPAYVGTKANPGRFIAKVRVTGPPELGTPSVEGLLPSDFAVKVGGLDADVLNGAYVQGEYWLTVQAPDQPSAAADLQDISVDLGGVSDGETQAVAYQVRHLDQMITVDRSGSMSLPAAAPKIVAAQNAGSLYVDVARAGDKLGVVSFSGDNTEPDEDATLDALLSTMTTANRNTARAKILGLVANGATSIGDGVFTSAAEYPIRGTAQGEDRIVLLSDGMENEGRFWSNVRSSVIAAGIKVDTIALGPLTDQALLQQIANDTGGEYYYVDVNSGVSPIAPRGPVGTTAGPSVAPSVGASTGSSLANHLADAFFGANEKAGGLERVWQDGTTLAANASATPTFDLDEDGITNAVLAVNWSSDVDPMTVSLVDPDGNVVAPGAGVTITGTRTHVSFQLATMKRGTWTVKIDNGGTPMEWVGMAAGQPAFGTSMWTSVADTHQFRKEPDGHRWGEEIPILASLTDKDGPITGAKVVADVAHPDGTVLQLPLMDDGDHGDGQAGDGVYAGTYTRTTEFARRGADDLTAKPDGSYQVQITARGKNNLGEDYVRYDQKSFAVFENGEPAPDTDGDGMPNVYEAYHSCLSATDSSDKTIDPDHDGLEAIREWSIGTDPCRPDTDHGGESDGSEVKRGANPFDPADDALPRPEDPSVIDAPIDHIGRADLQPGTLLIRYPANPAYKSIRLLRSTAAGGPFVKVRLFDSTRHGGLFRDTGLTDGTKYFYKLQAVSLNGGRSVLSPAFSGTPRKDPFAPVGRVAVNDGRPYTSTSGVTLSLATDDTDVKSMQISNTPGFAGVAWTPYAASTGWTLQPGIDGFSTVFVRYRDKAGNVSNTVDDAITVRSGLVTLTGVVAPDRAPADGSADGIYLALVGAEDLPLAATDATGAFSFVDVPAGSYQVTALGTGYHTTAPVTLLAPPGVTTVPVRCTKTEC